MRKIRTPGLMLLVLCAGVTWAEDIDAEILKDLDFYAEMEVIETDAMLDAVKTGTTERPRAATQEGDGK